MLRNPYELEQHLSLHGISTEDYFDRHVKDEEEQSSSAEDDLVRTLTWSMLDE